MQGPTTKFCAPTIMIFALIVLTVAVLVNSRSSEASGTGMPAAQASDPRVVALRDAVTVEAAGRGNPWVNFQNGRAATTALKGQGQTLVGAAAGAAQPVALASADFDGDGFADLVAGYSAFGQGAIALHRSNPESFAPTLTGTSTAISELRYPSPFRAEVGTTETQISPDFLSIGDFNNDGYKDIVIAARGLNAVSFLVGDGNGNLRETDTLFVPGAVTAMFAANIDWWKGTSDLMVGIQGAAGPQLLVYSDEYATWNATPSTIGLPGIASAITAGVVDNRPMPDIVVAAGRNVVIAHPGVGPGGSARVERAELPANARAVQVGRFIWDRENRQSIAVLTDDGSIRILTNGVLDRRPYSEKEQKAIKSRLVPRTDIEGTARLKSFMTSLVVTNQDAGWVETASLQGSTGATQMIGANLSNGITDDLLLVDSVNSKLRVVLAQQNDALRDAGKGATNSAAFDVRPDAISIDVANTPQAAIAMKVNVGTRDGLVLMQSGTPEPTVIPAAPLATFNVTTTADNTTCVVGNCSLRGATIQSNATAGPNQINVPAGTYTLSLSAGPLQGDAKTFDNEFFFCGGFIEGGGDLDLGNNAVTIVGTGNPIIQAGTTAATTPTNGNGIDRVFGVNDCGSISGLPINVTLTGLTIRNGKSPANDPDNNPGTVNSFFHEGGGIVFWAVNWITLASSNATLTMTNVTLTQNFAAGQGGGIKNVNGALAVNTSTVSNNLSYHTKGGGICYDGEADAAPARTLTVSGSTISGNSSLFNPVTNFGSNAGEGGGIQSAGGTGLTLTNTTINGTNHAALRGGGIAIANTPNVVITGGSISSNTSRGDGGGIWSSARTPSTNAASTVTINGTTISANAADSDNDSVCQVDNVPANNIPCGKGGGIMNLFGNMTVGNTTPINITSNTAVNGGGVFNAWTLNINDNPAGFAMTGGNIGQAGLGNVARGNGGGIAVDSGGNNASSPKQGTVTLTNVTLTGNTANSDSAGGGDGGGIYYNGNNANFILNLALNGTTIASNTANLGTGDGMFMVTGIATNSNTITFTDDNLHLNGGTFTSTAGTLNLGGNFTRDTANTFNHNNGTVNFNGAGAQLINGTATSTTFNNFIVNKSNTLSTGGSVTSTVTNNLTMTAGTFNAPALLDINGTATLNGGTLSAGANITEALNWTNNGGTFTPNTGTITFDGAVAQSINGTAASQTFFNFVVNKGAASTLSTGGSTTSVTVNNLTMTLGNFTAPATLDINLNTLLTAGTLTAGANITAGGNWTNNGGTFTPGSGTVTFDTGTANNLNGTAATQTFNNFAVNKSGGSLTGAGSTTTLTINGSMTLTAGTFAAGTITNIGVAGNWVSNGGAFTPGSSNVTFNSNAAPQSIIGTAATQNFFNMTVNKPGQTLSTGGSITALDIDGSLVLTAGTFSAPATLNIGVNFTQDTGFIFTPPATITFDGSTAGNINGTLATKTFNSIVINKTNSLTGSGGTTAIDINGNLTLTAGTLVAGTATNITVFGNWANTGTFTGGTGTVIFDGNDNIQTLTGSTTFNNLTINHTGTGNVDASASTLTVSALLRIQSGTFISSSNFNNVQIDSGQTLQGTNATTMNVTGNWTNNGGTFTANGNTVNFTGGAAQSINGTAASQSFHNFTVSKTVGTTLTVGGSTTALDINGNVLLTSGIFAAGTATTISVAGNWTNNATFTPGAGTVVFDGNDNTQTLAGNTTFTNLTINHTGTGGVTATGSTLTVTGLLRVQGGTFTSSSTFNNVQIDSGATLASDGSTMNVSGNWTNNGGTFTPSTGIVNFTGAAAQAINGTAASQTFGNFVVNKSAGALTVGGSTTSVTTNNLTMTLGSFTAPATLDINGNTLLTAGTLTAGANITAAGNWTNNGGGFTAGAGTVTFDGGAGQTIGGTTATTFGNLTNGNASGLAMAHDNTVNLNLALTAGDITVAATKTLTQPVGGSSTGTFDVNGRVLRTGFVTGGAALSFGNPLNTIQVTAGTAPANILVDLTRSVPTGVQGFPTAVQRTYTITPSAAGFTGTLRLRYLETELNGNVEGPDFIFRRFTAGPGWQPVLPTSSDFAANWLEATGVTQFSPWTFNSTVAPTASNGVITGHILDNNGAPVEGAVVRLEGTQNRKFITDANGVYRFEQVETNGFYTVTPSRANYTFSPSTRSFSQVGDSTVATFGATVAGSGLVNPLDTPEYFVRQNYLDFLGREPDEAGFNFWSDQIIGCGADQGCIERKRINVSAAYFLSIEFRATGGLVDGLYRAGFGVRPDFAQFMPDTRAIGLGVVVNKDGWEAKLQANKEAFVADFVNRSAFRALYDGLGNSAFVDTLIGHTGVSFTGSERDALVTGLNQGTLTRAQALTAIAENERFQSAKFNEAFVMMEYFGYLRRDTDADGFQFWLNKLNQFNGNFEQAEMVKAFIVSGEYRNRFPK